MRGREDCFVHRQGRADRDILRCALLSGQAPPGTVAGLAQGPAYSQDQAGQVGAAAAAGLAGSGPGAGTVIRALMYGSAAISRHRSAWAAADPLPLPALGSPGPSRVGCSSPRSVSRSCSAAVATVSAPRSFAAPARAGLRLARLLPSSKVRPGRFGFRSPGADCDRARAPTASGPRQHARRGGAPGPRTRTGRCAARPGSRCARGGRPLPTGAPPRRFPARPQVQVTHPGRQARPRSTGRPRPGPGQARRADPPGFSAPGIGRHDRPADGCTPGQDRRGSRP